MTDTYPGGEEVARGPTGALTNPGDSILRGATGALDEEPSDPVAEIFGRAREVGGQVAEVERERGRALEDTSRRYTSLLDRDRAQMERARQATEAAAGAIPPPWDADRERAYRIRDPIENFGSIGSIFAIVASGFTKTPMISALNGAAAAMQAIRASDERGYETAYQAWKDNTNLALKRFDMEMKLFDQSAHLMTTDMNAWRQQMLVDAAKFDNKKHVIMLQNGMDKELIDSVAAQAKAAGELRRNYEEMEQFNIRRQIYKNSVADFKTRNPNASPRELAQYQLNLLHEIGTGKMTPQERIMRRYEDENPESTAQERAKFWSDHFGYGAKPLTAEQAEVQRILADPNMAEDDKTKALNAIIEKRKAGSSSLNVPAEITRRAQQYETDPNSPTFGNHQASWDRAAAEVKKSMAPPLTAFQEAKLKDKQSRVDGVVNQIDRAMQLIKEAEAAGRSVTGVGGIYGRAKEFIFDKPEGAAEFEQLIRTIQVEVAPILKGSSRLTKDETEVRDVIVPGLGVRKRQSAVFEGLSKLKKILERKDLLEPDVPSRVIQDGNIFEKQSDGSFKFIGKAQ